MKYTPLSTFATITVIPILLILLSLYLPSIYKCSAFTRVDLEEFLLSIRCVQYVMLLQQIFMIIATTFALIMSVVIFGLFRKSLNKPNKDASV